MLKNIFSIYFKVNILHSNLIFKSGSFYKILVKINAGYCVKKLIGAQPYRFKIITPGIWVQDQI